MALADSNRVALRYVKEPSWAVTPTSPTMQAMRFTGDSLKHNKSQVNSTEIRPDRQVQSIIQTGVSVEGDVNIEMSNFTHEDFILSAIGAQAWTLVQLPNQTVTLGAQANGTTVLGTSGNPVTAGVKLGMWLWLQDTSAGAKFALAYPFKVVAIDASHITFADPGATLGPTFGAATVQISGKYAPNGTYKTSFTIEKQFTDLVNSYILFPGLHVDQWMLSFTSQKIIDGSFSFFGKSGLSATATVAGAIIPQTTTPSISASADVGSLLYNGTPLTAGFTKLQFMCKNNLRHRPVVSTPYDLDHGYGKLNVSATVTALVPDLTLFAASVAHSTISLDIPMTDQLGNGTVITIPAMKISGTPSSGAENQDVTIDLTMDASLDTGSGTVTSGYTMVVFAYAPAM